MKRTKLRPAERRRLNRIAVRNIRPRLRRPTAAELESITAPLTANASGPELVGNEDGYAWDLRHVPSTDARFLYHIANHLLLVLFPRDGQPLDADVDVAITRLAAAARAYVQTIDSLKE